MAGILSRGVLRVGVDQNTAGLAAYDPRTGRIEGFEIELAERIAQAISPKLRVETVALLTTQRIPYVMDGKVDLTIDAITINCDRRRQVAFSTVYFDAAQRLLVRRDSDATGLGDLAGRRVCATKGSTALTTLARYPTVVPYPVDARTDCLVALETGAVDAILADDAFLQGFELEDPQTRLLARPYATEPYGIAVKREDTDLVQFVNGVLDELRAHSWGALLKQAGLAPARPPAPEYLPATTRRWPT